MEKETRSQAAHAFGLRNKEPNAGGISESKEHGYGVHSVAFACQMPHDYANTHLQNTNQNGFRVQIFSKIIVESSNGRWSAWFRDVPEILISGIRPADAFRQLLCHFGEDQFQTTEIISLHDGSHDGHLEYMIPLRNNQRIPITSMKTDLIY